ncbi:transporter substrate-binding domain-containing protein [Vibrio sp. S4M6]|uniref:substrate-binding periplasmic protein n=1 Tax=Vibrio sinus TaxID=2946865 RepID=UPI00202A6A39|nr:transporter substrate-binding domain-containing protein [Vibrio sinus]MCL9780782.1 transporter substrate-binding domain-containing protein [Vibrio sinus]
MLGKTLLHICLVVLVVLVVGSNTAIASYRMHFFLPDFPPYTMPDEQGNAVGIGVDKMKLILDSIDVDYTFKVGSNHGRALSELRSGRSDGFFMASQNEQRDQFAKFANSVMVNRWVWVVRRQSREYFDPENKEKYVVASLVNTNTNFWLNKSGYKTAAPASDIKSLISKLSSKEVDAVFVAQEVFNEEFKYDTRFQIMVQVEKEFSVYISNAFLKKHPEFMEKLNRAIEKHR